MSQGWLRRRSRWPGRISGVFDSAPHLPRRGRLDGLEVEGERQANELVHLFEPAGAGETPRFVKITGGFRGCVRPKGLLAARVPYRPVVGYDGDNEEDEMGQLYIVTKGEAPRTVLLSGLNTLGRHPSQSIQLLDKLVSKAHAAIVEREGNFFVRDVGSRNGTLLNDAELDGEKQLESGDELALGDTVCRFTLKEPCERKTTSVNISSADIFQGGLQQKIAHETATEFRPVAELKNQEQLQADYERLRLSHELRKELANELELDRILEKILEYLLDQMGVERGAFLLVDEEGAMCLASPRAKTSGILPTIRRNCLISQTILQIVVDEKSAWISNDARLIAVSGGPNRLSFRGFARPCASHCSIAAKKSWE